MRIKSLFVFSIYLACLSGCANPADAFKQAPDDLALLQQQTRIYNHVNEKKMLASAAAILQDSGYTLSVSAPRLGLITAKQKLPPKDATQKALGLLIGVMGLGGNVDVKGEFMVTLVSIPQGPRDSHTYSVRITQQFLQWNSAGKVEAQSPADNIAFYAMFFDRLNKAMRNEKQF